MALQLTLRAARELVVDEVADPPLRPATVRVQTLFSGVSAGTEMTTYRGTNPFLSRHWDPGTRLFTAGEASAPFPTSGWGYEEVGVVLEAADTGDADLVGCTVYGTWGHRTHGVVSADHVRARVLPEGVDPMLGVFARIGSVALNGVHDGRVRIGETVVVVGLGVLGQIVAQAARHSGARVIGVDLHAGRRKLAGRLGATVTLDPADETGVAERVRSMTDGRGADVVVEATGSSRALAEAIRCAAYSSRVVCLGFMPGEARGLVLGEEFHHNRVTLVGSQISGSDPEIAHRWDATRLAQTTMRLQADGVLDLAPLVSHVRPFDEAPELFRLIDETPQQVMQVVLSFDGRRKPDTAPL